VGQVALLPWGVARRPPAGAGTGAIGGAERKAPPGDVAGTDALLKVFGAAGPGEAPPRIRVAVVHDGTAPPPPGLHPDEVFLIAFTAGVPEIMAHVQRTGAAEAYLSPHTPLVVGQVLRDLGVASVTRLGPPEQLALAARGSTS
jgi:hypothetical protein